MAFVASACSGGDPSSSVPAVTAAATPMLCRYGFAHHGEIKPGAPTPTPQPTPREEPCATPFFPTVPARTAAQPQCSFAMAPDAVHTAGGPSVTPPPTRSEPCPTPFFPTATVSPTR